MNLISNTSKAYRSFPFSSISVLTSIPLIHATLAFIKLPHSSYNHHPFLLEDFTETLLLLLLLPSAPSTPLNVEYWPVLATSVHQSAIEIQDNWPEIKMNAKQMTIFTSKHRSNGPVISDGRPHLHLWDSRRVPLTQRESSNLRTI